MRPLFARAVAEHEALLAEAGALRYLRKEGWLKLYRGDRSFGALKGELALAQEFGIPYRALDTEAARELEPSLAPVFRHAVHWQGVASITNPLAVTQAYARALCRARRRGGARRCALAAPRRRALAGGDHRGPARRRAGGGGARPFAPDVLAPLGIKLPLGLKRGYHRTLPAAGKRRAVAAGGRHRERLLPRAHGAGIRLTTGVEFAARDAPPTRCSSTGCCRRRKASSRRSAGGGGTLDGPDRPCFSGFPARS
jgi:D-amino-acid dehydrogenase